MHTIIMGVSEEGKENSEAEVSSDEKGRGRLTMTGKKQC